MSAVLAGLVAFPFSLLPVHDQKGIDKRIIAGLVHLFVPQSPTSDHVSSFSLSLLFGAHVIRNLQTCLYTRANQKLFVEPSCACVNIFPPVDGKQKLSEVVCCACVAAFFDSRSMVHH